MLDILLAISSLFGGNRVPLKGPSSSISTAPMERIISSSFVQEQESIRNTFEEELVSPNQQR
jgi:hypothetical protein